MKRTVAALLAAAALFALTPAEAADDPSGDASGLTAYVGLASIATPVLASAATAALTIAGGKQERTIPPVVRKDYLELNQALADEQRTQPKGASDAASHP